MMLKEDDDGAPTVHGAEEAVSVAGAGGGVTEAGGLRLGFGGEGRTLGARTVLDSSSQTAHTLDAPDEE